jgi:signal transduction histidine kinase/DNA-binding response OmpR family regulator/frataxin-like iron-binding protein CyaY
LKNRAMDLRTLHFRLNLKNERVTIEMARSGFWEMKRDEQRRDNTGPGNCFIIKRPFFSLFVTVMVMVLGLLFWGPRHIFCQDEGFKFLKNYAPVIESARGDVQSQNWSITQDKRGIIYVANSGGVLEFDGAHWRLIRVPNKNIRSLGIDEAGTVYVGGSKEIGFLAPDEKGSLQYQSLLDYLNEKQKKFTYVWRIHATKEGVYFHTAEFLFRWNSREMKVWEPDSRFLASFMCKGKLFVRQKEIGLMWMNPVNDSLELIPGGETFADKKVFIIAPYDKQKLLIGTRASGFYTSDNSSITSFPTKADDYMEEKQLYYGIRLCSGDFALGTRLGGLVIIDSQGELKQIFTKASGLQDDYVRYIYEDLQGNLWLALNKGTAKIEYASPVSIYDDRTNLPGIVLSVTRHGPANRLYAGTDRGLYMLAPGGSFHPVIGISSNCFFLLSVGDSLLAAAGGAAGGGVFQVDNKNNIKNRAINNPSYFLLQSQKEPNRIWVGTRQGLVSLRLENSRWVKEHIFKKITQEIRTIVEDKKGNLWLGIIPKDVLKVDFPGRGKINDYTVNRYEPAHGLPAGEINVFAAAGHVIFATDSGIFRFHEKRKFFIPDFTLGEYYIEGRRAVFRIVQDKDKVIWFHSVNKNHKAIPGPGSSYVPEPIPFLRIPPAQVDTIYPDPDGNITWFASHNGLIRFDKRVKKNYEYNFPALIRKVVVNENLVFDGYKMNTGKDSKPGNVFPVIAYQDRSLHFDFAAPFFEDESATKYRYFLEGYDKNWSPWTSETQKNYTKLDSGMYRLRVQARDVYENKSQEDVYQFKILLPWYREWWAFLSYALILVMLTYLIFKWRRSIKLEHEKKRLEKVVKERTREITEKNRQLEEQSQKLKELDNMKSRFFANISHEFRTPLTLIMGPLEQMLSDSQEERQQKEICMMLHNSQRLLTLINQLLDLSKLDSGKMRLQAAPQNIVPFLKEIMNSFSLIAAQNKLILEFYPEQDNITLYFDEEKMEEVFYNLLSNAVKFTPAGGKITVHVRAMSEKTTKAGLPPAPGVMEISVCDTGIGIPKEQLPYIFERFYQVDGCREVLRENNHKSTGIGLALTKELVGLHHGRIDVHSRGGKNSGTEFIVCLPMGKENLKPGEIINPSEIPMETRKTRKIPVYVKPKEQEEAKEPLDRDGEKEKQFQQESQQQAREKNVILVVEDSLEVRRYISRSLEPGYTVIEAVNGREGMKKAKETIPDLIISDIMMPEADGYELCNVLKKDVNTSHIPIILLTAKASEKSIIQGLKTGADDYITKPFNTKILITRIKNLIDLRRQLQLKIQRKKNLLPADISVSSMDEEFLKEFQEIVEKNLADSDLNIDLICKKLYMSRATLFRKIHALTGETPNQFIQTHRLERAAQLLKAHFGNITEVALEVGFSSSAYFTKCFREKFHQLPSTYQAIESKSL